MLTDKISVQFFIEILCLCFKVFNVGILLVHSSCVTVGALVYYSLSHQPEFKSVSKSV